MISVHLRRVPQSPKARLPRRSNLRAQEEALPTVPERFRPWQVNIQDPRLFKVGRKSAEFPAYVTAAKPPEKDLSQLAVFDGDGVFTDGVIGGYFHDWMWTIGAYKKSAKAWSIMPFVRSKLQGDFITYHELGPKILAGLSIDEIRRYSRHFVEWVVMHRDFNVARPYEDKSKRVIAPFVYPGSIELLVEREKAGKPSILASGSLVFLWEALFENMHDYAEKFEFGFKVPKRRSLIDFFIGARPKFDSQEIAIYEAERPLSIGGGKSALVGSLLKRWGVEPMTTHVYTDDIRVDRLLLQMTEPGKQHAINLPSRDEELAQAFGYDLCRTDGRKRDERSSEDLSALHLWRKALVSQRAARYAAEKMSG